MTDTLVGQLWYTACSHLRKVMHADTYSRWIDVIEPVSLEDDVITLAVENDFYQSWLEDNYISYIRDAVNSAGDTELEVKFTVAEKSAAYRVENEEKAPQKEIPVDAFVPRAANKQAPGKPLNSKFTFDTFIVGPSNNFAHAATLAVAQAPGQAYNPLFIYGGTGLGKTHLMQAVGHHVAAGSEAKVCYLSSEDFTNEYIDALQNRSLPTFRKKYRNYDVLLIDDIHFLAGKERMQEEFFHTFNALHDARKQIVLTSDRPASEIMGLEKRLVSRFEWGLVTELEPPCLETRIAILRNRRDKERVNISDAVIQFMAQNIRSNIRRLEGAFIRVVSYSSLTNQDVTIETIRTLLKDYIEKEQETDLSFESIQRAVADHYDVRLSDMSSKRRSRSVAVPRQVAMYICRRFTDASLPDIANSFGKTHATVMHACKQVEGRMDVDGALKNTVTQIAGKLGKKIC